MSYQPIENYGIIGNMHTVALVGVNGSIDWFCFPELDSPSVFAALLDDQKGGAFSVQPSEAYDSVAEYMPQTNILVTRFHARSGALKVIDFMSVKSQGAEKERTRHLLYRLLEMESGHMALTVHFEPRFDFARQTTHVRSIDGGAVAEGSKQSLALTSDWSLESHSHHATGQWAIRSGDKICLRIASSGRTGRCADVDLECVTLSEAEEALKETRNFWINWLNTNETGRTYAYGAYQEMVERSALVLKLLYYEPSGAIAAAPTTSLPEEIGGVRNWDYRFTWIRDASFTLRALYNLGHLSETEGYLQWINNLLAETGVDRLKIMYGFRGEPALEEVTLDHLDGYKQSHPVRIGNAAADQRQLDIYGELMDAALKLSDYAGKIKPEQWEPLRKICDYVVTHWEEKDFGIWEVRNGPWHFVHSKVLCWVALDRGITIAKRYGFKADLGLWEETGNRIHAQVCQKGFNEEKRAFVQHYETDALDSSNLLIPLLGFLPFDDERVASTVEATVRELGRDGLLYRYRGEDGMSGREGTFLLCSFWLVECLIHLRRLEEAESLLKKLEGFASPLGLFSEEYDIDQNQALGNFPQAFTHIGYINSVTTLIEAKSESFPVKESLKTQIRHFIRKCLLFQKAVLNKGRPDAVVPPGEVGPTLKSKMNLLRGAFFDTAQGRIAYELMRDSDLYGDYVETTRSLRSFDPKILETKEEKIAFWLNLYNVLVIHGVINFHVNNSVKEVLRFFRRICYEIDGLLYTADDIEHGILRSNKKPPHSLFRLFGQNDPRRFYTLEDMDPRIHFGLVCASSSCPPIDVYTAENLDEELTLAGKTFLNSGGLVLDRDAGHVQLSRIFKWYGEDFGNTRAECLITLAEFLYDETDRDYIKTHAHKLSTTYLDYDWRLNRG